MIGQMMKHHFIGGLLLVLAGCTLGPEKREPPTVFDFGPPRAVTTAATVHAGSAAKASKLGTAMPAVPKNRRRSGAIGN